MGRWWESDKSLVQWIGCWTQDQKVWGLIPNAEVLGRLRIPHFLGPPSHNGYLVHRSKVGSIAAGCIGAHLASEKVESVEHALSWCLES